MKLERLFILHTSPRCGAPAARRQWARIPRECSPGSADNPIQRRARTPPAPAGTNRLAHPRQEGRGDNIGPQTYYAGVPDGKAGPPPAGVVLAGAPAAPTRTSVDFCLVGSGAPKTGTSTRPKRTLPHALALLSGLGVALWEPWGRMRDAWGTHEGRMGDAWGTHGGRMGVALRWLWGGYCLATNTHGGGFDVAFRWPWGQPISVFGLRISFGFRF